MLFGTGCSGTSPKLAIVLAADDKGMGDDECGCEVSQQRLDGGDCIRRLLQPAATYGSADIGAIACIYYETILATRIRWCR